MCQVPGCRDVEEGFTCLYGGIGLFVGAIDDKAAQFYRRYGFVASPEQPLLMFLSVNCIHLRSKPLQLPPPHNPAALTRIVALAAKHNYGR